MSAPVVSPELRSLLRRVKLGRSLDTLPERLALAGDRGLGHAEFLELVLADEVARRDTTSAERRARVAGLDPTMRFEHWDHEAGHNALVLGPVGVGKTFLATALGHAAVRRRHPVHFERADRMFKRLRAARLDNSHEAEVRKLLRVDLLIVDDLCLTALDATDTAVFYEIVVERHRRAATVVTSNREPIEWLGLMADPLLAQSAIDRLQSAAYELVLDGDSYRRRQRPSPGTPTTRSTGTPTGPSTVTPPQRRRRST
jgi:DNA replication protein DnaC